MAKPNSSPVRASVARLSGAAIGPRVGSPKPNSIVIPPLALPLGLCPPPELSRSVALQEAQSQSIHTHPGSFSHRTSYPPDGGLLPIRGKRLVRAIRADAAAPSR